MRAAHRGDPRGVAGRGKPIVDRSADSAALYGRIAAPVMARDEQHDAFTRSDRPLQAPVDGAPRGVEIHSVQIEHAIRLNFTRAEPPVPASVQG